MRGQRLPPPLPSPTRTEHSPRRRVNRSRSSTAASSSSLRNESGAFFCGRAATAESADGAHFLNDYVIAQDVGRGASGTVQLAYSLGHSKPVAIKVIARPTARRFRLLKTASIMTEGELAAVAAAVTGDPSPAPPPASGEDGAARALEQEMHIMKCLNHPNIVRLYEVINDPHSTKIYLVMQYVDRGSVARVRSDGTIAEDSILPPPQLTRLAVDIAAGLAYLHRKGVVHRDIKPENILVSSTGDALLADFGVAEVYGEADEAAKAITAATCAFQGTPLFMAPEIYAGLPLGGGGGGGGSCLSTVNLPSNYRDMAYRKSGSGGSGGGDDDDDDGMDDVLLETVDTLRHTTTTTAAAPPLTTTIATAAAAAVIDPYALDVWALGVTFLTLLTGRVPFRSFGQIRDAATARGAARLIPPSVPDDWRSLLLAMLDGDPARRITVAEVHARLQKMAPPPTAPPPQQQQQSSSSSMVRMAKAPQQQQTLHHPHAGRNTAAAPLPPARREATNPSDSSSSSRSGSGSGGGSVAGASSTASGEVRRLPRPPPSQRMRSGEGAEQSSRSKAVRYREALNARIDR